MIFYPAIDLKDGACVRLVRGEMATATVFNADPAAQAREFVGAGCRWGAWKAALLQRPDRVILQVDVVDLEPFLCTKPAFSLPPTAISRSIS